MKRLVQGLTSAALIGLVGCSDVLETEYTNTDNNAQVTFYVTESQNAVALDSVMVQLITLAEENAVYTDSNGVTQIENLALGDSYTFKIVKDGYAAQTVTVDIFNASGNADYAIAGDQTRQVSMYKLGGQVSGQLFVDVDGTKEPAEGATIRANINCGTCDIDYVETTVNADGSYTFENLPLDINTSLVALPFELDGVRYGTENLGSQTPTDVNEIFMTSVGLYNAPQAQALEVISTDLGSLDTNASVVIDFTQAVNTDEVKYGDIEISNGSTLAFDESWNSAKTKLTLTATQGYWQKNDNFTVSLSLESEDGDAYNGNVSFDTYGNLGTLGNIRYATVAAPADGNFSNVVDDKIVLDGSEDYITLEWDEVSGVTRYEIWYMRDSDEALAYSTWTTSTQYQPGISPGDFDIDEGPAYIQIRATNGEEVSMSPVIKIRE